MNIDFIEFVGNNYPYLIKNRSAQIDEFVSMNRIFLSPYLIIFHIKENTFVLQTKQQKIFLFDKNSEQYLKKTEGKVPKLLMDEQILVQDTPDYGSLLDKAISKKKSFSSLYVSLTDRCNLNCIYCFSSHGNSILPFSTVKAAIDFLKNKNYELKKILFLSGGEHTLESETMKESILYAKKINPDICVYVTTNGNMAPQFLDWLEKNTAYLAISCDGPPFIQDKTRPMDNGRQSSTQVEGTISSLVKDSSPFFINTVFNPLSIGNENRIIKYFFELGVKKMNISICAKQGRALSSPFILEFDIEACYDNFLKLIETAEECGIQAFLSRNPFFSSSPNICGAIGSNFVLTADGLISLCTHFSNASDLNNPAFMEFFLGKFNPDSKEFELDEKKANKVKKGIYGKKKCYECQINMICNGGCPLDDYYENQEKGLVSSNFCENKLAFVNSQIQYYVQKHLIQKIPFLLQSDKESAYIMGHNSFRLSNSVDDIIEGNPYICISDISNLGILADAICCHRNARDDLTIFVFCFQLNFCDLNYGTGKKILNFLSSLKEKRIFFKVANYLPPCLFTDYKNACIEYKLPIDFSDALSFYSVDEKDCLTFINGIKGNKSYSEYFNRKEIIDEFEKFNKMNAAIACISCVKFMRGNCKGWLE